MATDGTTHTRNGSRPTALRLAGCVRRRSLDRATRVARGNMARLTMTDVAFAAAAVRAECKSGHCLGASARYPLRCKDCGYEWHASYKSFSRGHGCSRCANRCPRVPELAGADISHMSFGRWTVIGPASYRYWLCRCARGTQKV